MPDRPNLLLFMPETLRADAVLGESATRAQTPHFDAFAAAGVNFTQTYAQMAFCTPSRCCTFTGLYPHTRGHRAIWHLLQRGERNLFQDLKEAGYRTVVFGKNDLLDRSWAGECFDELQRRVPVRHGGRVSGPPPESVLAEMMYGGRIEGDPHDGDAACIDSALEFLAEPHDQPWCLFLPLSIAHPTYAIEEPFFSQHDRSAMPAPIPPDAADKRTYRRVFHEFYGGDRQTDQALREVKATYFGMVSRSDRDFGKILNALAEHGLDEQTVTVMFSDHGDYAGDYGLVEKFCIGFEDCLLRVPLMIRAPGIAPGECGSLVELLDLYPTLLDLLGLESGHFHFGRSLAPLLESPSQPHRDAVFAEGGKLPDEDSFSIQGLPPASFYGRRIALHGSAPELLSRAAMVLTAQHKYVSSPGDCDELYDRVADPDERVNLAGRLEHQATVAELRARVLRWLLETSDTEPLQQGSRAWS